MWIGIISPAHYIYIIVFCFKVIFTSRYVNVTTGDSGKIHWSYKFKIIVVVVVLVVVTHLCVCDASIVCWMVMCVYCSQFAWWCSLYKQCWHQTNIIMMLMMLYNWCTLYTHNITYRPLYLVLCSVFQNFIYSFQVGENNDNNSTTQQRQPHISFSGPNYKHQTFEEE